MVPKISLVILAELMAKTPLVAVVMVLAVSAAELVAEIHLLTLTR